MVFTEGALPAAHPVTYLLDDEEVIFRIGGGSKLAAAARHHIVGFQADEIDPYTRTGWSVLGVGEAYEVVTPIRLAGLADTPTRPLAPRPDRAHHRHPPTTPHRPAAAPDRHPALAPCMTAG